MSDLLHAPFTHDQVKRLNAFQRSPGAAPVICGNAENNHSHDPDSRLVATVAGWICCYCDFTQTWAYAFMAESVLPLEQLPLPGDMAEVVRTLPTSSGVTFEMYLRFWLEHGNSLFVAAASDVSSLQLIVAPQVSINARSLLGQFRFTVSGNTVEKIK